ncbi:DNA internalization-related competence protein ComEC/Rec2 [Pseudomonadales bacterium]|nr:DNA internalization-related competence protein ComEC/Rec2 [Pseudomonadales bacterium]
MNAIFIAFVCATLLTVRLPIVILPSTLAGLCLFSPIALFALTKARGQFFGAFYLGVLYVVFNTYQWFDASLPPELEQKNMVIEGYVSSLPVYTRTPDGARGSLNAWHKGGHNKFQFQIEKTDSGWGGGLVQLSWYTDAEVRAGQKLRLEVRLNRPRGLANHGLFDYEAWLFSRQIVAIGYVRSGEQLSIQNVFRLKTLADRFRQNLSHRIRSLAGNNTYMPLLLALSLGASQEIPPEMWEILSSTGTNHLLIISGLHVGLIAALSLGLFRYLLKRAPNTRLIAGILSGIVTLFYGLLAGGGLPVQRALTMVFVVYLALFLKRSFSVLTTCCLALFCVVLIDPFASLSPGFWLSFGAVFLLLFVFALSRGELSLSQSPMMEEGSALSGIAIFRHDVLCRQWKVFSHKGKQMIYSQWVVFAGMAPLMLINVSQLSLIGFLANLVAIPFVSLVIVPLTFASLPAVLLHDAIGAWLVALMMDLLSWLWRYLTFLSEFKLMFYPTAFPLASGLSAILAVIIFFAPGRIVPRWLCVIFLLPLLIGQIPRSAPQGEVQLTLLDVGQGLSVVIKGANHTVVYDTGPKYGARFDTGQQIVTPFLRSQGINRIDRLIVSHNDNDHAGGAEALRRNFEISETLRSAPVNAMDISCDQVDGWIMDGVKYSLVQHVSIEQINNTNDQSCVLLVQTKRYTILLPGDISSDAEERPGMKRLRDVNLLISPHHGSATSSGPAFLNRLAPDLVLVSAGYNNKFGHPHKSVLNRYRARSIKVLNTAETGAVTIKTDNIPLVSYARQHPAGIWRPLGAKSLKTLVEMGVIGTDSGSSTEIGH